jgi:hypothetical protein
MVNKPRITGNEDKYQTRQNKKSRKFYTCKPTIFKWKFISDYLQPGLLRFLRYLISMYAALWTTYYSFYTAYLQTCAQQTLLCLNAHQSEKPENLFCEPQLSVFTSLHNNFYLSNLQLAFILFFSFANVLSIKVKRSKTTPVTSYGGLQCCYMSWIPQVKSSQATLQLTVGQSVYVLVSRPIWDFWPEIFFFFKLQSCLIWGALSDERSGLSFVSLLSL